MTEYQEKLKGRMDEYVHLVYRVTRGFPKEETYASTGQWRRATLSIILNYIEGYARRKPLVQLNFLETAYGSFKESRYLLDFSYKEQFLSHDNYQNATAIAEEIGAMLWTELNTLTKSLAK
ncbi:MAG: four helix bundle protein [bacterium]|nr:four helix bundle protein [bacterium]